jgi:short-subunit dehydrogenase
MHSAAELGTRHGITVHVMPADLADPTSTSSLVEATRSMPIRLFVHAAGFGSIGSFLDLDRTNEVEMVDLNCRSVVDLSHVFGGRMRDRGEGRGIVLFGSLVGFQGAPMSATYAATKGFVQSFAEALAGRNESEQHRGAVGCAGTGRHRFCQPRRHGDGIGRKTGDGCPAGARGVGRRTTVRPGLRSKFLGWSLSTLPRPVRVRILGKIMGGMRA